MNKIYIEIDFSFEEDKHFLNSIQNTYDIEIIKTDNLSGTSEIITVSIELTTAVIGLIAAFFEFKRSNGRKIIVTKRRKITFFNNENRLEIEEELTKEMNDD